MKDIAFLLGFNMTSKEAGSAGRPPVHDVINIIESVDLFKTDKWWKTVTLQESFGRKEVAVYLFLRKGERWVRKQKFTIRDPDEWRKIMNIVNKFMKSERGLEKGEKNKREEIKIRSLRKEATRRIIDTKREA